jgi:hypothetical protein
MFGLFKKKLKTIDKTAIGKEIENFKTQGVEPGSNVIVSLTSFPERMYEIHYTLYSLLNQTFKPEKVILWLAEEQFPNKENDIPEQVLKLKENGLEIEWCENINSYKKLIPVLRKYPNKSIVTADDDLSYEKNWLEKLIKTHEIYPDYVIANRSHTIKFSKGEIAPYKKWKKATNSSKPSYLNFLTSGGGVLFPPSSLYKDILNENLFLNLAPNADDIWFWAMTILNNTKIVSPKNSTKKLTYINPARERGLTNEITLFSSNKKGGNDIQLAKVIEHYPEILKKLL